MSILYFTLEVSTPMDIQVLKIQQKIKVLIFNLEVITSISIDTQS